MVEKLVTDIIGLFAGLTRIFLIGILCEVIILLFQLITLPVEFNASRRGLKQIEELHLVEKSEMNHARSMLKAAAMTYVASAAAAVLEILRLVLMMRRRD